MGRLRTTATLPSCHCWGPGCPSGPNAGGGHSSQQGDIGPGERGLASILRPWPAQPIATWLTGFPPCLGHELTSAPLTGRGEGVGRAQATHCAGSPPSPSPRTMAETQPVATAAGEGVGMSTRRGRREGSGRRTTWALSRPHPSSRTWLVSLPSPAAQRSGLEGGKSVEGGGSVPQPGPSLLGGGSVWILLEAGNKGPH